MVLTQKNRLISVKTPLGTDALVLAAFEGTERISRLFSYELKLLSDEESISVSDIVGKNVTINLKLGDGSFRHINGFVKRFLASNEKDGRRDYRAEVVPWLWFLTRTSDCRIFQDKTVPQIIEQIFGDLGFSDYDTSEIKGTHEAWEYCVQYRETDFSFVSRLMEQEGIFYFFRHDDGRHTLVLGDQNGACKDCLESQVDYPRDYGSRALADHLTRWEHRYEYTSGKWSQTDYNFVDHPARGEPTPSDLLMTEEQTTVQLSGIDKYEIYEYPGRYPDKGRGQDYTKIRMEAEEARHDVVSAASTCRTFGCGGKFQVKSHPCSAEEGKRFVITSIRHQATTSHETGAQVREGYSNTFDCIPDSVSFRPQRTTSKPVVQGSQTAVVVGPAGEEIWPDEYGRVKVQFHWDREGKRDENSSCWIRCMQTSAGKGWGAMFIPRIGQEVVVSYLDGDPDRPLITGTVYNADMMPPYALPDEKTKSTVKTHSSKEGNDSNYNEIRFEDKKGKEQLFIHAEKNQDIEVENDETHWVGNDRKKTIDRDETTEVKRNRTESVGGKERISIAKSRTETVGDDESVSISKNRTHSVDKEERLTVGESRTTDVGKNEVVAVGQDRQESVGKNETIKIGENRQTQVGKNDELQVAKTFALIAGDQIQLQTGKASLIMKKNGDIEIKGKNIKLVGSGKIDVKASGKVAVKGSKIDNN